MNHHQRRAARARGRASTEGELEERLHMIRHNEHAIHLMLAERVGDTRDPVVLLIDERDSMGAMLAEVLDPQGLAARIAGPHQIPTAILVCTRHDARRLFVESHAGVAEGLGIAPRPGVVPVVCIASEGVMLVHLPLRSVTPSTSA
jgi:hypothetical protein